MSQSMKATISFNVFLQHLSCCSLSLPKLLHVIYSTLIHFCVQYSDQIAVQYDAGNDNPTISHTVSHTDNYDDYDNNYDNNDDNDEDWPLSFSPT